MSLRQPASNLLFFPSPLHNSPVSYMWYFPILKHCNSIFEVEKLFLFNTVGTQPVWKRVDSLPQRADCVDMKNKSYSNQYYI